MIRDSVVTIKEASLILGVNEATLRQWTDEGRLKAFITPGGHRRYAKSDLLNFMNSSRKVLDVKDLASEMEDTVRLHRQTARRQLEATTWYGKLDSQSQEHLAELGRRLLGLIVRHVTDPSAREETITLARQTGHDFGMVLAESGLPLTDSVEAFMLHRDIIMNTAGHLMKKREAFSGRFVEAIPLAAHLMDESLVALVSAHQQRQAELKGSNPS
ncbi:MAG: MerR family transcriptional regulator [Dehalococcoidia bacterium]